MPWLLNLKEMILGPQAPEVDLHEKRLTPRVNCFIEAHFATEEGETFQGSITVLEISGMRIVSPRKITKGQKIIVRVDSFSGVLLAKPFKVENVNAEVVWCKKKQGFSQHMAGIKFTDPQEAIAKSWVNYVLESFGVKDKSGFQRRKDIRVSTTLPVRCFTGRKDFVDGVAYDIGLGGIRMKLKGDLGTGKEVSLQIGPYRRLPPLKCRGKIRRSNYHTGSDAFIMGVEFVDLDDKLIKLIGSYIRALLQDSTK